MDVLRLYAIYLLCSCYMWILGSVYILQPDVLDVADGVSLQEVRHDLGTHTVGLRYTCPYGQLSYMTVLDLTESVALPSWCSETGRAGLPISSMPAYWP